ncbi:MAG: GNAT family N-acetyltransferase [Deltaproteobacteria bacterium]|nr:GNAT family N-acetyltransferase [Deltaproteobacteria bacterium]
MRELTDEERALPRHPLGYYRKYGITFIELSDAACDIELLRTYRNQPEIRQWMLLRDEITVEGQLAWFRSLDPARESFSIIWNRTERIGLTQLRHIDMTTRSAEGGIILFKPEFQNGLYAHRAALAGMDWNFVQRGLETLRVTVLKTNSRARRLVRSLGYVLSDPDPTGDTLLGEVSKEGYFRAAEKWRAIVRAEAEAEVDVSEW